MLRTYEGTLKGNQIDWSGEAPDSKQTLHVHITVLDEEDTHGQRGRRMAAALKDMAQIGGFSEVADPSEWQREIREDRPLPGRELE